MFQIKTENFNGPLDLLLQLIEQEKLDITQVNLAKVADQYLNYVKKITEDEIDSAASIAHNKAEGAVEFLVIASQLLLIKSKILLPEMQLIEEEEEEDIIDLEARLREYKRFKEVASKLAEIATKKERGFERKARENFSQYSLFKPPEQISPDNLKQIFEDILKRMPKEEKTSEKLLEKTITLEEKMEQITNSLKQQQELTFTQILENSKSRLELVVTFLSILELIKQQIVRVTQTKLFEPIKIISV